MQNRKTCTNIPCEEVTEMTKILLADDNAMNRDMLSRRLQRKGYDVVTAVDGKQAVTMVKSERPDLIIMDLSLPEMDGWEATRYLKSDHDTKDIPLIILTAHTLKSDRESAFNAGCDDFDVKPVDFQRLLTKIERQLHKNQGPEGTRSIKYLHAVVCH